MSDARQEGLPGMTRAADIESQAADWLERKISGVWGEKDQAALEQWLAGSSGQRLAFLRLSAAWSYADRLSALKPTMPERNAVAAQAKVWPFLFRGAAVFVAAMVLGGVAAVYFSRPHVTTYATAVGRQEKIILTDGSQIELNTNTVLRAVTGPDGRTVWLDKGEAFFQIAHDSKRPFIVMVDHRRVTVLGTKFLVRRDTDRLEVAVMEGRVRLDAEDELTPSHSTLLVPGEAAIATGTSMSVTRKPRQILVEELGWRRGVLVFDNTALADAAVEFNRYNKKKIILADPAVARLTIGGTFPVNDVELFVRVTRDVLGLRVESHGDEEVVSR
jgi:transmembrane sensor